MAFLLAQDGSYLLLYSGGKIILGNTGAFDVPSTDISVVTQVDNIVIVASPETTLALIN